MALSLKKTEYVKNGCSAASGPSGHKTRKCGKKFVRVSALAVAAMKCQVSPAFAQTVNITCKQPINIGNLVACSPGSYVIAPDGAHSVSGCLIINTTAIAGTCKVTTIAGPPTKNVIIKATATTFIMNHSTGASSVSMRNIKLQRRGSVTSNKTIVITPGTASKTMTIDVGATLRFADGQTIGSYTGNVVITANFAP